MFKMKYSIKYNECNFGNKGKILFMIIILTLCTLIWILLQMDNNLTTRTSYLSVNKDNSQENNLKMHQDPNDYASYNLYKTTKVVFRGERIVHLDLKGAPPKISYYKKFFNLLAKLGATGVIMEYEDMFPYQGPLLGNISALNAYTLKDIKEINDVAKTFKIKIIPLVQTFGHMEFFLKNKEWKHLREVPRHPQVICPSHNETLVILKEMIEQVIEAHPDSNMLHIGADEVYLIGECDKCFLRMNLQSWTKQKLFLHHVSTVAHMIIESHPSLRLLMWDDEFRKARKEDLEYWKLPSLVEPVVWKYVPDVYMQLGPSLWDMYASIFPKIWIASAFKGATGSDKYTTNIEYHLENHKSWMQIVSEYSGRIQFEGMILTGWQRYDHFAILCELLPVGIPSLAMCLHFIQGYIVSPLAPPKAVADILQCENPYALLGSALGTPQCSFPGANILEEVLKFQQLKQDFSHLMDDSKVRGWMSDYNVDHTYSNVMFVESAMETLDICKMELIQIEKNLRIAMESVYDNYTINEWCETFIKPMNKKIESVWEAKEKLLSRDHWPRRPFLASNKEL